MMVNPVATFHPTIGLISIAPKMMDTLIGGSEQPEKKAIEKVSKASLDPSQDSVLEEPLIPNDSHLVLHGRDGSYLMDKAKWPNLLLPSKMSVPDSEGVEVLTQEESLLSQNATQGGLTLNSPSSKHISLNVDTCGLST